MLEISEETYLGARLFLDRNGKLTVADHGDALSIKLGTTQLESLGNALLELSKYRKKGQK